MTMTIGATRNTPTRMPKIQSAARKMPIFSDSIRRLHRSDAFDAQQTAERGEDDPDHDEQHDAEGGGQSPS